MTSRYAQGPVIDSGLVPGMRALGFTDRVLRVLNLGAIVADDESVAPYEIPLRIWTCRCGRHQLMVHDTWNSGGFSAAEKRAVHAMLKCHAALDNAASEVQP